LPARVEAQEVGARGHEVRPGETLWALAVRYLGSGPEWRAIYELNRSSIADPNLLLPGQRLSLPGGVTGVSEAPLPADEGAAVAPGLEKEASPSPTVQEDPIAGPSLFDRSPKRTVTLGGLALDEQPDHPLVSQSDFNAAPFLASPGEIVPVASTARELLANPLRLRLPATVPLNHRVRLVLDGLKAAPGDRLLAFKWKHRVGREARVVEPVAVLAVLSVTADSADARVTEVFGAYEVGDPVIRLLPYPSAPPLRLREVEGGITGRILAFANRQPLLGLSELAFLDVGAEQGVGIGDEFVTFDVRTTDSATAPMDQGQAILRVVQTRPGTSTAVVVLMQDVGTVEGAPVRLVRQAASTVP